MRPFEGLANLRNSDSGLPEDLQRRGVPLQVIRDWLGQANISQTSTYLESTFAGQHEAMRAFERRLQKIATEVETGSENPPPDTTNANATTQEITVKHH